MRGLDGCLSLSQLVFLTIRELDMICEACCGFRPGQQVARIYHPLSCFIYLISAVLGVIQGTPFMWSCSLQLWREESDIWKQHGNINSVTNVYVCAVATSIFPAS